MRIKEVKGIEGKGKCLGGLDKESGYSSREILQSLLIVTDVAWAPVGSEDESVHGGRTVA